MILALAVFLSHFAQIGLKKLYPLAMIRVVFPVTTKSNMFLIGEDVNDEGLVVRIESFPLIFK